MFQYILCGSNLIQILITLFFSLELFYQLMIFDFGNYGILRLSVSKYITLVLQKNLINQLIRIVIDYLETDIQILLPPREKLHWYSLITKVKRLIGTLSFKGYNQ